MPSPLVDLRFGAGKPHPAPPSGARGRRTRGSLRTGRRATGPPLSRIRSAIVPASHAWRDVVSFSASRLPHRQALFMTGRFTIVGSFGSHLLVNDNSMFSVALDSPWMAAGSQARRACSGSLQALLNNTCITHGETRVRSSRGTERGRSGSNWSSGACDLRRGPGRRARAVSRRRRSSASEPVKSPADPGNRPRVRSSGLPVSCASAWRASRRRA